MSFGTLLGDHRVEGICRRGGLRVVSGGRKTILQHSGYYIQSYNITRLQDSKDYKATRMQNYKTAGLQDHTNYNLQEFFPQPVGPKGPADI